MRLGRPADAREEVIRALTFHPSYETPWKIALQAPATWNIKPVQRHPFDPPHGYLGENRPSGIDIFPGKDGQWLGYAICKAVWANEPGYETRHSAGGGGWSTEEEHACVLNQLMGTYNATEAKLEEEAKARGDQSPAIAERDVRKALPPLEAHIFEVAEAKLLDGYILFEIIGQKCPMGLGMMPDDAIRQMQEYIRRYVIVAAD